MLTLIESIEWDTWSLSLDGRWFLGFPFPTKVVRCHGLWLHALALTLCSDNLVTTSGSNASERRT